MAYKFAATGLAKSKLSDEVIELTFTDKTGATHVVTVTPELGRALAQVLSKQPAAARGRAELTKMPKTFGVGASKRDQVVMVRFEDEPPYGLSVRDAMFLGYALLDEVEELQSLPVPALQ